MADAAENEAKAGAGRHARWAVRLRGEEADLSAARRLFEVDPRFQVVEIKSPSGEPCIGLRVEELDAEDSANSVRIRADRLVDLLNAARFLQDPNRKSLRIAGVFELSADGNTICDNTFGSASIREDDDTIVSTGTVGAPGKQQAPRTEPTPSDPQRWALAAAADDAVADVLSYLRGDPGWFDLYKAFEAIQREVLPFAIQKNGVTADADKRRWRENALWVKELGGDPAAACTFVDHAGDHRHHRASPLNHKLPANEVAATAQEHARIEAEKLRNARAFIATLVKLWLAWRESRSAAPPTP